MRAVLRSILWPAIAAVAFAVAPGAGAAPKALLHKPAPLFARNDLQHRRVDLRAYRGKVVLLTFWATWCAPCQIEIPRFVEWQRSLGPRGFQVLAVSMDDDAEPVIRLTQRRHVNYPVMMGDAKLAELYGGVMGLPVNFLIDQHGEIVAVFQGETNLTTMLERIRKLLPDPALKEAAGGVQAP